MNLYHQYRRSMSQAYRRISSGGKVIETSCGAVQYAEIGDGPPVLMVHGAGGGYDQGQYFAKLIGGNYRWICPSRFGFLGTPAPEGANSSMQAEAHAALLDALEIDRVNVVGVSMGGPSCLLFALQYPQRTRSLVMISAASHAIKPRPAIQAALFSVFLYDFIFWSLVRFSPKALLVALGVPAEIQKELTPDEVAELQTFLESIIPMGARRKGQSLEQQMSEYDAAQIKNIQVPTQVLHARDDTLVSFEHGEFTAKSIPDAQFSIMEKGGHLALMLRSNTGARRKILEFLEHYHSPVPTKTFTV
ncbi:MAG TPA: alpha/beta hydrolase [Anaerolineales bacterium]|nr:alpha/beta hydrolase [Anaerolineales bacterium]